MVKYNANDLTMSSFISKGSKFFAMWLFLDSSALIDRYVLMDKRRPKWNKGKTQLKQFKTYAIIDLELQLSLHVLSVRFLGLFITMSCAYTRIKFLFEGGAIWNSFDNKEPTGKIYYYDGLTSSKLSIFNMRYQFFRQFESVDMNLRGNSHAFNVMAH